MIRQPPSSTLFPTRRSSDLYGFSGGNALVEVPAGYRKVAHYDRVHHARRYDVLARDRKSTRLNSSHQIISYAVFCLQKKRPSITNRQLKSSTNQNNNTQGIR